MPSGLNEEGIGFETRSSGECEPPDEKSNLFVWMLIGIGVIALMA
jgi:hypothetical protein